MSTVDDLNDGVHVEDGTPFQSRAGPVFATEVYVASTSPEKRDTVVSEKDVESVDEKDERDIRKKQVFKGRYLFWLAYQSIGVIYGDIGTSPLYVYSSTFTSEPSHDDLLGVLSLIIWTITLMVSIKYVLIVLRADDEGEGGTFAVYSLLTRYAKIVRRDPREERGIKMERVKTSLLASPNKATRSFLENSAIMKTLLKVVGVFGVSLVMSDGILTPAQSVLGAIQGLKVVDESITTAMIIGVSCAILILLFLIQPFGISKIGSAFAPIVIIWLTFNFCFGIYNLVKFDYSVLKAFSPYFAGAFFVNNKTSGWKSLGGILLAFTGVEALFADLGAFSREAIQLSWLCFTYPCLLLAYIGQAAYISQHNGSYSNPFFNSVPPGMFYPSLVVAILAAIVASQTMITATFQLLSQIVKLSYFPQIKVTHTSRIFHNQIYISWVNWLLLIGTVCVTAAYNNTTKLGEAYGVCVILVTFLTTCMVTLVTLVVWRQSVFIVIPIFLVFGTLDGLYLSSALTKVPDGAWFTLCLAIILASIFVLWRFGKENQWHAEAGDKVAVGELLFESPTYNDDEEFGKAAELKMMTSVGTRPVSRLKGIGVFFDKTGLPNAAPVVFVHFLQKFQAAHVVNVFFHIRPLSCPTVAPEDRFSVSRCRAAAPQHSGESVGNDGSQGEKTSLKHFYRVTVRHGYTDNVISREMGLSIYEHLCDFIIRDASSEAPSTDDDEITSADDSNTAATTSGREQSPQQQNQQRQQERIRSELRALQQAFEDQIVYIVGKEQMRIADLGEGMKDRSAATASGGLEASSGKRRQHLYRWVRSCRGLVRSVALAAFLWLRSNTGSRVANMDLEVEKLVEVGFVKVI